MERREEANNSWTSLEMAVEAASIDYLFSLWIGLDRKSKVTRHLVSSFTGL